MLLGGRYRLDSPIGEGGMAVVWKALQLPLNRPVAIKFLHSVEGPRSDVIIQRFLREARALAAVKHPNVVQILDFGETEEGHPFMAMELLEGDSLCDRLDGGSVLSLRELEAIMDPVFHGLAAVHESGIVHRDVKPENIFLHLSSDGLVPKLLDFGVSRSVGKEFTGLSSAIPTVQGLIVGTPQYMSAEQARGIADIDLRTDIYSLGVILYQALTGLLPFDSEHFGDIIVMISTGTPPPFHELRPDLGPAMSALIERAMARDRDARFQHAREMLEAFKVALIEAADRVDIDSVPSRATGADNRETPEVPSGLLEGTEWAPPLGLPQVSSTYVRKKGRGGWVLAAAICVFSVAALAWLSIGGENSDRESATAAEFITIRLNGVPSQAQVRVDGKLEERSEFQLSRSEQVYELRVQAPGFEDWVKEHSAMNDGEYEVGLKSRPASDATEPDLDARDPAPLETNQVDVQLAPPSGSKRPRRKRPPKVQRKKAKGTRVASESRNIESRTTESPTTESRTTESPTTESPTTESPTTESPAKKSHTTTHSTAPSGSPREQNTRSSSSPSPRRSEKPEQKGSRSIFRALND